MRSLLILFVIVWFSAAVSGVVYMTRFANTPGEESVSYPSVFPPESGLERDASRPTLIFFAHPKCPCTRASLRELERLMAEIDGKVKAYVVFIKPNDATDEWTQTSLRAAAEAISNVQVVDDDEERERNIFNAQTSSLTLLYDRGGNLRFDGGITAARGHEGDNAGRAAISEIVMSDADTRGRSLVFGCPLHKNECPGALIERANDAEPGK